MSKSKVQNAQSNSPKTKKAKVLALLMRRSGATVSQIGKATGWQAHSIRAALNLAFLLRVAMIWDKVAAPEADPLWKL
jgi:hypothetical protein